MVAETVQFSEFVRTRLAATWGFRTRAEIEATQRFSRMARELGEIGAERIVIQGAADAADDEARHRDLCAGLAERWGDTAARQYTPPHRRIGRSDMAQRDRLLWEVVAVCCIAETMNTSLLMRCLEVAKHSEVRLVLHELTKDEVRHARLGWAHLAAERSAGRGAFLSDVLPLMLDASVEPGFLEGTAQAPWTDELYDYGELPWHELVQIYCATLNVVFRGLDALGLDTVSGRQWLRERVPAAE